MNFHTLYGHFEFFVMSFGLTNSLMVFMDLINKVFRQFLDLLVIVFIDEIFLSSKNKLDHANSPLCGNADLEGTSVVSQVLKV